MTKIRIEFYTDESENDDVGEAFVEISEADTYVELVKKYGYQDAEGIDYTFDKAQVGNPKQITIFLNEAHS